MRCKSANDGAVCSVAAVGFSFSYPACDNLGFGNLVPLVRGCSAPARVTATGTCLVCIYGNLKLFPKCWCLTTVQNSNPFLFFLLVSLYFLV